MMTTTLPNLVYLALLLAALGAPFLTFWFKGTGSATPWTDHLAMGLILVGAVLLTIVRGHGIAILQLIFLIPFLGRGLRTVLGACAASLLFQTALWWLSDYLFPPGPIFLFILLAIPAGLLLRMGPNQEGVEGDGRQKPRLLPVLVMCGIAGLMMGMLTAPYANKNADYLAWHHWGAFLSPVEAWLAGGLPYRDFPIQYGLGPTTLIAATCGNDCWRGLFFVAATANALYFSTLAGCAAILTSRLDRGIRWLALIALFFVCFFWTGYPVILVGPTMTPAVAGIRFLTVSALLLHILTDEQRGKARDWIGHLIWLIDLFWSPEAAFFGTVIWWPYLALRAADQASSRTDVIRSLIRTALQALFALALGLSGLATLIWLLSGRTATLGEFLAYIQHPPGPLPIDPLGAVWLALAMIGLALWVLTRTDRSPQSRSLYACTLGVMATGTYFLSRSHDNNILNLLPIMLVMLLAILSVSERVRRSSSDFIKGFVQTILMAVIAFVSSFNLAAWIEGITRDGIFTLGPARLIAHFTPGQDDTPPILSPEAERGMTDLRRHGVEAMLVFDKSMILPRARAGSGWTGVNNLANFVPLPREMRLDYIRRDAAAYHRPGWLLIDRAHYGDWLAMFRTVYDVQAQRDYGSYSAYYLVPR